MKLTFQVRFRTSPGQSLWLTGNHELFGNDDIERAVPLQYLNEEFWKVVFDFAPGHVPDANIVYSYVLRQPDGSLIQDWGHGRTINPASFDEDEVCIIDGWNFAGFYENAFSTEPFQRVLLKPTQTEARVPVPARTTHIFKIKAPLLEKGQTLGLLGNTPALSNWNTAQPVLLNRVPGEEFLTARVDLSWETFPIAYKYAVFDFERRKFIRYEDGGNRTLVEPAVANKLTIVNDGFAVLPSTTWKGAGVALPVFSLRSQNSFGVGEFTDLKPLADWCRRAGLKLIQILPINDTSATHTWLDSYPYAAISAFALHPLYLNLSQVAAGQGKRWLRGLEKERQRLNALGEVDYESVMEMKLRFVKRIYPLQRDATFKSKAYRQFFDENRHWLTPYAVFCFMRDKFRTADFTQWPEHSEFRAEEVAALAGESMPLNEPLTPTLSPSDGAREKQPVSRAVSRLGNRTSVCDEIGIHYFIQYHLHVQLREATDYAHANGVVLKGDIPIGVARFGADAWQRPDLFHSDAQAGAPPDAFAAKGQNWGFPTYNWQRMKADGFAWWKQRFEQMGRYFDAFRVDHILGFFRIWSIPLHAVEGILGRFVPAIPVDLGEFTRRGIPFDRDRLVKPFITDQILRDVFGSDSEEVKHRFLDLQPSGRHALKPEFATQRQVERYFAALEPNERNGRLKEGLFDLISNVILFEADGSQRQQFHFRFGMESTASFRNLDAPTQAGLKDLYVDYFYRRQDHFWLNEAMQKLPALKRVTNMLICGEDLGLVPACVPDAMKQLGLLSLEIQRMPKDPSRQFSRPADAPYLSVVTPGTHDMSTIRGWWKEDRDIIQRLFNEELGQPGKAPDDCEPWINREIVRQHLASPAMWSIFQLQDLLGMDARLRRANPDDERINVPANPRHYWRYRIHLTLEELLEADAFNDELAGLVKENGR